MKNLISLLLLAAALVGGVWLIYFGPYYKDELVMEEVTQTVALTWAAYNQQRAASELESQLRQEGIDYITPEHCDLKQMGDEYYVSCAWQVDVYPPLVGGRRLDFAVESVAGKDGRLVLDQ